MAKMPGGVWYILDAEKRPVKVDDVEVWGRFFEDFANRRVGHDVIGDKEVSTVFVGMDHRTHGKGPPVLFETVIFENGSRDGETHRYVSWDDAKTGHDVIVAHLQQAQRKVE